MDIKVEKSSLPVIQFNFEEVKANLEETLEKYKGIVVTKETLSGCKATQKELAGLRTKVDAYRKEKKKELSAPIVEFEDKCKELIALIEQAEQPIKEGIKVFDDKKRDEKRAAAERLIAEIAQTEGLNDKYTARLDVLEKYCNLTATEGDVKHDIEQRAFTLKVEQDREQELLDIIQQSIDTENERLKSRLTLEAFRRFIDSGAPAKDVLAEIKAQADRIYAAENPKTEESPAIKEPQTAEEHDTKKEYRVVYEIVGARDELMGVSGYLRSKGIKYTVLEQNEV